MGVRNKIIPLMRAHNGVELAKRLPLAWSPYVTLLTIDNPEERRFYEIEAEAAEVQYL